MRACQCGRRPPLHSRPKWDLYKIFSYLVYLSGGKQDDYSILLETFQGPIMTPTFVQSVFTNEAQLGLCVGETDCT